MAIITYLSVAIGLIAVTYSLFLRAKRTSLLLEMIKPGSGPEVIRAMILGYILDLLLPFRIGQVVRGIYQSKRLKISLLFSLTSVAIERSLDVFVVSILFFFFVRSSEINALLGIDAYLYFAIFVSGGIWVFLFALSLESHKFFHFVNRNIGIFNESIGIKARKSIWSTVQILREFSSNKKTLKEYFRLFCISWGLLLVGLYLFVSAIFTGQLKLAPFQFIENGFALIVGTIKTINIWSLFSADFYINNLNTFESQILFLLLQVPTVMLVVVTHFMNKNRDKVSREKAVENPSGRYGPYSPTAAKYVELYFKKDQLVTEIGRSQKFKQTEILDFFKGSSSAATMLISESKKQRVRKIVFAQDKSKLEQQYIWLKNNYLEKTSAQILQKFEDTNIWGFDQEYFVATSKFFDFILSAPIAESKKKQLEIFETVKDWLYDKPIALSHQNKRAHLKRYIEESLFSRLDQAVSQSTVIAEIIHWEKQIVINGETFNPFVVTLGKIRDKLDSVGFLPNFTQYDRCHGDLTVDNILISNVDHSIRIIDPSDDNEIKGPTLDMSRYLQSLRGGYEFSLRNSRDTIFQKEDDYLYISFLDNRSWQYSELEKDFIENIYPWFTNDLDPAYIDLFTGILFVRMINHRVRIHENSSLEYFAKGIMLLSRFMENFE